MAWWAWPLFWPYHLALRVKLHYQRWSSTEPLFSSIADGWCGASQCSVQVPWADWDVAVQNASSRCEACWVSPQVFRRVACTWGPGASGGPGSHGRHLRASAAA